jgi:hypothetical protein
MVHSWAVGSLLAETICVADVYLHHHTNVLSYSASISSGRLLLISNPSNHSMFWCLQAVENNQMECTAKIEIHGSTVGYWLHFIPNSLFRSVTYTGQHASKCYQKDAFKGVETCITPQLQVSPQWLTQMVYKTSSPPCLLVSMSLRIWGKVHMGGGGAVLFTAWFWQAAKNVWNDLISWHPTVIVLYHVIQSCRKMTPSIDTNCSTVHMT